VNRSLQLTAASGGAVLGRLEGDRLGGGPCAVARRCPGLRRLVAVARARRVQARVEPNRRQTEALATGGADGPPGRRLAGRGLGATGDLTRDESKNNRRQSQPRTSRKNGVDCARGKNPRSPNSRIR